MEKLVEKLEKTKVKDVLHRIKEQELAVKENTSIKDLINHFEKHPDISVLPVLDEKGKIIGEVLERDLLKLCLEPKKLSELDIVGVGIDLSYFAKTVSDLMRRHQETISPDATLQEAVVLMFQQRISSIPVVEDQKIVGVLSEMDILDVIQKAV